MDCIFFLRENEGEWRPLKAEVKKEAIDEACRVAKSEMSFLEIGVELTTGIKAMVSCHPVDGWYNILLTFP